MRITFANASLRELCAQQRVASRRLGAPGARKLRARLADLVAAACVTDLVAGRLHPLQGDRAGQFALDLEGGRRLVIEPDHDPRPIRADGGIDWERVTPVSVVFVGDYHD